MTEAKGTDSGGANEAFLSGLAERAPAVSANGAPAPWAMDKVKVKVFQSTEIEGLFD